LLVWHYLNAGFIHTTVHIPISWGDTNTSIALLKSLRLALEISLLGLLAFVYFKCNLEVEPSSEIYGRVSGIPASLQPLLGDGQYVKRQDAEKILTRLHCIGKLAISVASIQKLMIVCTI
jgi:CRISPR-associated protein Csc3